MKKSSDIGFVVGVTGHRDLPVENEAALSQEIVSFLNELQSALGSFPLTVACGMADGADRLVARCALKLGIRVQAVLPMPKQYYLSDFEPHSIEDLESLLSHTNVSLHEISLPPGISEATLSDESPSRNKQYGKLGEWLFEHSNLMLGIWDGSLDRPEGGTADVLLSYLFEQRGHLSKEGISALNFIENAPTLSTSNVCAWIEADRQSAAEPKVRGLSYLIPASGDQTVARTKEMPNLLLERLAGLKDHFESYAELKGSDKAPTVYGLLDGLKTEPPNDLAPILRRIDSEFHRADSIAIRDQASSSLLFKSFALLGAAMGFLFLLYAKLLPIIGVIILYLFLFAAAFIIFGQAGKRISFSRYLVNRVIAESMRVRFYMLLAGVSDQINLRHLVSLIGIENMSGFSWLHEILRMSRTPEEDAQKPTKETLRLVKKAWIDDQLSYFHRMVQTLTKRTQMLGRVRILLLGVNFLGLISLVIFGSWLSSVVFSEELDLKTFLVFLLGLLPLWVGIWELYQNKVATRELLWQYRNQAEHFQRAATILEADLPTEELQRVIADLGERSLFETYLWTIHRYHRESEPPAVLFGSTGFAMFQGRVQAGAKN